MTKDHQSHEWNYHPDLLIKDPSVFKKPPNPPLLAHWICKNWLMLSECVMVVLLAFALWYTLYPSLETALTWGFAWVLHT